MSLSCLTPYILLSIPLPPTKIDPVASWSLEDYHPPEARDSWGLC